MAYAAKVHIIKLGGSLCGTPELTAWLAEITAATTPIIIVPGGGPFADSIRQAQADYSFDNSTAHRMALLAMAQFGLLLQSLAPSLAVFSNPAMLPKHSAIWLPDLRLATQEDIAHSWRVTADSLALWLAQQHHASLALVKSDLGTFPAAVTTASQQGILDADFPSCYARQPVPTTLFNATQSSQVHDWYLGNAAGSRLNG